MPRVAVAATGEELGESREALYVRAKASSVFCLEPEGDSPDRKSVYDSLLLGCIPVVFSRRTLALSPLHWYVVSA